MLTRSPRLQLPVRIQTNGSLLSLGAPLPPLCQRLDCRLKSSTAVIVAVWRVRKVRLRSLSAFNHLFFDDMTRMQCEFETK